MAKLAATEGAVGRAQTIRLNVTNTGVLVTQASADATEYKVRGVV